MTYKLQTAGMLMQPSTSVVCTRLAIQGIVHCTVVNKFNINSKWKFNLTVSIKYWYIKEGLRAFLVRLKILGGDCWNIMAF